jgi:hypothetical protein
MSGQATILDKLFVHQKLQLMHSKISCVSHRTTLHEMAKCFFIHSKLIMSMAAAPPEETLKVAATRGCPQREDFHP